MKKSHGARCRAQVCAFVLLATLGWPAQAESQTEGNVEAAAPPEAGAQSDVPVVPLVVHHREHSLSKKWQIQAGPALLVGDRYLHTVGGGAEASYFFSDAIGSAVGAYFFQSSPSENGKNLANRQNAPIAHDPSSLFYANFIFSPWYGKFSLGSRIQRFQWSITAGAHMAREKSSARVQSTVIESKSVLGGNLGTSLMFPLNRKLLLAAQFQAFLHGKLLDNEPTGRRNFLYGIQLGYLL